MTKKELKEASEVATNLAFNFVNRKKAGIDFKWTKKMLRQDIKQALAEVSEDYGYVECKPVISAHPDKDEIWLSLWGIGDGTDYRCKLDRTITWQEFKETILDSDPHIRDWFAVHFREILDELEYGKD